MKKIISFSLYGKDPKYTYAAIKNAKLQPSIYPGWNIRIYTDEDINKDLYNKLLDLGAEIIMKPKAIGHLGMFWRFEPLKDDNIDYFIVRDTDSRLNEREADAVNEWIESGKEFHIMRDHIQHAFFICGGMWGASKEFINKEKNLYDDEVNYYLNHLPLNKHYTPRGIYFNVDQPWLWKYIWPKIINSHMAHIKDLPALKFTGKEKIFKKENPDNSFIGQAYPI